MPTSVTPLTARAQATFSALLAIMAVMGLAPYAQVLSIRWPLRLGEFLWRYETALMVFANAPQVIILIALITGLALLTGFRKAVRGAAIGFAVVAITQVIALPFFLLDYFQVRRLVASTHTSQFKAIAVKTLLIALIVSASAAWGAFLAWRASENENAGQRRQKGEGLVVGQPKATRPGAE